MSARDLKSIERPALAAERRLRIARAIVAGTTAACVALAAAAVILALRKTEVVGERFARVGLALAVVEVVVVATLAYLRPLPLRAGAVALDRFHRLSDRLASALSFASLPEAERTPFMDAAIDDALAVAPQASPKKAVPFKAPRDLPLAGGLAAAVLVLCLFETRHHVPVTEAKTIDAVDVTPDDLDAMRDFLKEMQQKDQTEEGKAATQEFNQLIEDLAAKRLDRTEAFRRMQALEEKLLEGREADAKALEDALQKIGEEMKKADLTKPAGEALDNNNLVDAQEQLHDLAKKLRENGKDIDKKQLDKMREALKQAAQDQAKRNQELQKRRDELEKQLLQQKQKMGDAGAPKDEEKSLLQKRERELERLNRDQEQQQKTQRQLDRLDRELSQAAEDLMKDLGLSANDLDQGAEDINRMAKEEMSQEEKEQLRQKLQELREMLRQQGQGGQQQMVRLRRFQQHAHGQGGQGGGGQDQQQGEGKNGGTDQQGQGREGQGQGQGGQQGGQPGQGQGQNGQGQNGQGQTWVLGPNGEKILMLSKGGQGQGQGQGQGGQNGGQGGDQPNGQGWGTGHDGHVEGQATNPQVGTQDTQVAGQDTGQGASRAEVIQGAAERGFASRRYTNVYRDYHTVAEESLAKDDIPGGYRFYVRRYFDLIRPRE